MTRLTNLDYEEKRDWTLIFEPLLLVLTMIYAASLILWRPMQQNTRGVQFVWVAFVVLAAGMAYMLLFPVK